MLRALGTSLTEFASRCDVSFSVWHRIVHAPDDPNTETVIAAKLVKEGMPLGLVAPTLERALRAAGWTAPSSAEPTSG